MPIPLLGQPPQSVRCYAAENGETIMDCAETDGNDAETMTQRERGSAENIDRARQEVELLVMHQESKIKSTKAEIEHLEKEFSRVLPTSSLFRDFIVVQASFQEADRYCEQECLRHSKIASLSGDDNAELKVFATRARFIELQIKNCDTYKSALVRLLNRPDNEKFRSKRRTLSDQGKQVLLQWFDTHLDNPFPSAEEKEELAIKACASVEQVTTWFINARARRLKRSVSKPSKTPIEKSDRRNSLPEFHSKTVHSSEWEIASEYGFDIASRRTSKRLKSHQTDRRQTEFIL